MSFQDVPRDGQIGSLGEVLGTLEGDVLGTSWGPTFAGWEQMQKLVYTVMQDWEIKRQKQKTKKKQWCTKMQLRCDWKPMIKSQKCNAPPNTTKNFGAIYANLQLRWNIENSALLILLHEMLSQTTIVNNSKMSLLILFTRHMIKTRSLNFTVIF